ncbi:hypothetical protein [Draconibacterium sp.]|uniref:hypothetical protein n=1 Tax=Draconibacterium sp. TaxID=1965318 RepID=UPI003568208A
MENLLENMTGTTRKEIFGLLCIVAIVFFFIGKANRKDDENSMASITKKTDTGETSTDNKIESEEDQQPKTNK